MGATLVPHIRLDIERKEGKQETNYAYFQYSLWPIRVYPFGHVCWAKDGNIGEICLVSWFLPFYIQNLLIIPKSQNKCPILYFGKILGIIKILWILKKKDKQNPKTKNQYPISIYWGFW